MTDYTVPLTNMNSEDKQYENSCSKRNKIILIISILSAIIIIFVTIFLCFHFLYAQKDSQDIFSFVYFNDIHVDPLYVPNSQSTGNVVDCRKPSESAVNHPFGQYGCDSANLTFFSLLNFLPTAIANPQFVLFGGDIPAHEIEYSLSELHDIINSTIQAIHNVYPKVPVLYCLGNHDFAPNNGFNNFSVDQANFESIAPIIKPFTNDIQQESFKKGGYYYHDFPEGKLRLLILDTIIYNEARDLKDDPYDQFSWIRKTSQEAHELGYRVGASIHIPPGIAENTPPNFGQGWREEYMKIFDQVVKDSQIEFILAAHIHLDLFMPIYQPKGVSKAYSLSAPAVTSSNHNNPSFRIIQYSDGQIVDYIQYYADIMNNPQDELDWKIEYRFKEVYNFDRITSETLSKVIDWIKTTAEGRWSYIQRVTSMASSNVKFYYCSFTSTTKEEMQKCLHPLN